MCTLAQMYCAYSSPFVQVYLHMNHHIICNTNPLHNGEGQRLLTAMIAHDITYIQQSIAWYVTHYIDVNTCA